MIAKTQTSRPVAHGNAGMLRGSADERAQAIVERVGGGRYRHGSWRLLCPGHQGRRPSLIVTPTADRVLIHCFAGCTPEAVLGSIGLQLHDLYPDDLPPLSALKKCQACPRIPAPPGPVCEHSIALHLLVELLVDDVSILGIAAAQACLRQAMENALQVLWLQRQLHQHGLSFELVRKVVDPGSEHASPRPSTPIPALATRLPRRVSPTLRSTL